MTSVHLNSIAPDLLDRVVGGIDLSSVKINPGAGQCNGDYPQGGHSQELSAASPDAFKPKRQMPDPLAPWQHFNDIFGAADPSSPRPPRLSPPRPAMR